MCEDQDEVCLPAYGPLQVCWPLLQRANQSLQAIANHKCTHHYLQKWCHLSMGDQEHISFNSKFLIARECSVLHLTLHLEANIKVWRFHLHRLPTHILEDKIQITIILCLQYVQQSALPLHLGSLVKIQVTNVKRDTTSMYNRPFIYNFHLVYSFAWP